MQDLAERYGAVDWYQWQVDNWGTKWDISYPNVVGRKPTSLYGTFDTAWSPPIEFYDYIEDEYKINVQAWWNEPGCDFLGRYKDRLVAQADSSRYVEDYNQTGTDPLDIVERMDLFQQHKEYQDEVLEDDVLRGDVEIWSCDLFNEEQE